MNDRYVPERQASRQAQLSRRSVLGGALLGGSAVALGLPGLAACGKPDQGAQTGADKAVSLPTYVPRTLVEPDLPGNEHGVQPAYLKYPRKLEKSNDELPSWETLTSLVLTWNPPPPPREKNTYWKAVEAKLGGQINPTLVPAADYTSKVNAVLAGNDLPDTVFMSGDQFNLPGLPQLLQAKFADLSEYLAGDAVKDFPNLANIPTYSWRLARVAGRMWGVPLEQSVITMGFMARLDTMKQLAGATPDDITTTDDLLTLCRELTSERDNRWALGPFGSSLMLFLAAAFGAPNQWGKKSDGSLVRSWETEEYVEALDFHVKLVKAGLVYPGFAGLSTAQAADLFSSGKIALYGDGVGGWRGWVEEKHRPVEQLGALYPLAHGGGDPHYYLSPGLTGVTMFRKDEAPEIKERLAIVNALAAPFGSEESMLIDYGVKGVDYELQKGEPVITARGLAETKNGFYNIGARPRVLYSGASPEWARRQHAWETKVAPAGVEDPSVGVYSKTATKSGAATQAMEDTITDVVSGRKSVKDFQRAVRDWRSKFGDQIRTELQEGLE